MAATLTVDLNAKIAQFETEMKRATSTLDRFGKRGDVVASGLKSAFGALAAGLSVGALASFAKSGIDAADALNDMSQKLGVSVKDLASLKLIAEQSGTSLESVGTGMARLGLGYRNVLNVSGGMDAWLGSAAALDKTVRMKGGKRAGVTAASWPTFDQAVIVMAAFFLGMSRRKMRKRLE